MIRTLLLGLTLLATPALADEMAFFMKNGKTYDVAIELYGERPGRVWPGDDKVYLLGTGEKKSVPVDCDQGERICWGGWRAGDDRITFGVGPDNTLACTSCCVICVAKTTTTIDLP